MRVVHDPGDGEAGSQVLATEVEVAESTLATARGLMFRRSLPEGFALVLELGGGRLSRGPSWQFVHMLFVGVPLDVVWLVGDEVTRATRLSAWTGFGAARADRVVEFPAGNAEDVTAGDAVRVEADTTPPVGR
jgi:uncharacterized membrane protein (UPF0127 family)